MTFMQRNQNPKSGDLLRDQAASLLVGRFGEAKIEKRSSGKKTDVYLEAREFGRTVRLYVECKDYASPLRRDQVVSIWTDYSGVININKPASLLIVTRNSLTSDAQSFVEEEQSDLRHQTIWDLENDALGLDEYVKHLSSIFEDDGLDKYYVPARARGVFYDHELNRSLAEKDAPLMDIVDWWLNDEANRSPIAILGGYGAGKTSFSKQLCADQAKRALQDPTARRPVIIRLGSLTRYSSVEGLLGGTFTAEFPVERFSFSRFMDLNKKGRLLIILDGFDEMKHAMSWADFRSQVSELNKLIQQESKVVLLGRPSAFMSSDEHAHVLRGQRRHGEQWLKVPGWPNFLEFEVETFNGKERAQFVKNYLTYIHGEESDGWIKQRIDEVNSIADRHPDMFSKPVHAKMFTDMASNRAVDLSPFQETMTRWDLYELFFTMLAEREEEKSARRRVPGSRRIQFLEDVSHWLWTEKGGATYFSSEELPMRIMDALPDGDATDFDGKRREYLTGSILEKKSGDVFYFGHRSFAEFLVARLMSSKRLNMLTLSETDSLLSDGVVGFLADCPLSNFKANWAASINNIRGPISWSYMSRFAAVAGSVRNVEHALSSSSPLRVLLSLIETEEVGIDFDIMRRIEERIPSSNFTTLCLLFASACEIRRIFASGDGYHESEKYGVATVARLLELLFSAARHDPSGERWSVDEGWEALRDVAISSIRGVINRQGGRYVVVDSYQMYLAARDIARSAQFMYIYENGVPAESFKEVQIPWSEVLERMGNEPRQKAQSYFQRASNLGRMLVVARKK